jgi:hypothetical protein
MHVLANTSLHAAACMQVSLLGNNQTQPQLVSSTLSVWPALLMRRCCEGRVVSVLEGGYNINGGVVSAFARSVEAHVRGLAEPHLQVSYLCQRLGSLSLVPLSAEVT